MLHPWGQDRERPLCRPPSGAGVIDVKAFWAESATDVAERIRLLLRHVAPDKLWLNPDCGFWETPRWVTQRKLQALVEGARVVRAELKG